MPKGRPICRTWKMGFYDLQDASAFPEHPFSFEVCLGRPLFSGKETVCILGGAHALVQK